MSSPFTIAPLNSAHDRRGFSCCQEALDRYFREQVSQDVRRRVTNCFVATDPDGAVAGYYTFAASGFPMTELPADESKRLPRYPLLPAGLIGRLAVATRCSGRGLGAGLIVDAISRAMRADPAIFAIVVDAKDEQAARFYLHLGFRAFVSRPMSLFLPIGEAARRMGGGR